MARVIVDTWFVAHKGHVPDAVFQQRRKEWGYKESEQGWRRTISEANGASTQILVAMDENHVIAVAANKVTGPDCAEIDVLYVSVPYQRSGIGRRLVEVAMDHYCMLGISTLHIAVLATNRKARRFYESLGGMNSGTRYDADDLEIVYAWSLSVRTKR